VARDSRRSTAWRFDRKDEAGILRAVSPILAFPRSTLAPFDTIERNMKSKWLLLTIAAALALVTPGCAHMMDPCSNKLLKRIPSPNGSLVLSLYDRQCPSTVLTTAAIEKPAGFLQRNGEVVCYVMSWSGRHPVTAEWKDGNNISIGTTDRLERFDFYGSKESCNGIKISYSVQFRNEQQTTDDPEVVAKIRRALADIGPCITAYYQAGYPTNDPVGYVNKLIDNGEHRSAVENMLGYASDAKCPISADTYESFKELSDTFDLKPGYLERIAPLVKR